MKRFSERGWDERERERIKINRKVLKMKHQNYKEIKVKEEKAKEERQKEFSRK